jgi:hypothetical protein
MIDRIVVESMLSAEALRYQTSSFADRLTSTSLLSDYGGLESFPGLITSDHLPQGHNVSLCQLDCHYRLTQASRQTYVCSEAVDTIKLVIMMRVHAA